MDAPIRGSTAAAHPSAALGSTRATPSRGHHQSSLPKPEQAQPHATDATKKTLSTTSPTRSLRRGCKGDQRRAVRGGTFVHHDANRLRRTPYKTHTHIKSCHGARRIAMKHCHEHQKCRHCSRNHRMGSHFVTILGHSNGYTVSACKRNPVSE